MAMAAAAAYNRGGGGGGFQVEGDRVAACAQQRQFWVDVVRFLIRSCSITK